MSSQPLAGDRFGRPADPDRYVLVERLGTRGGEGEIWHAHRADDSPGPPREYAVKMLTRGGAMGDANRLGPALDGLGALPRGARHPRAVPCL